ncbi:heme oxygenase-like domain-containing protein [Roseivivax sp. CAU 1753]
MSLLRDETAAAHAEVEARYAAFMAAPAPHMRRFLTAQLIAFRALSAHDAGPARPGDAVLLSGVIADLTRDLGGQDGPDLPLGAPLCTDAVAYLTLGSRLGTEVIKRHLTAHGLQHPRAFDAPPPKAAWLAFRQRIDAMDPQEPAFATLLRDARTGFGFFATAATLTGFAPRREAAA